MTLHGMWCYAKTESDEEEIYCVVTSGSRNARIEVGSFDIGRVIHPDKLVWNGGTGATIRFMESDENEPEHGSDDFIGEVVVDVDGNCKPGHGTLDEGYGESKRYRQFSMTGSGAHYVVQLEI